MSDYFQMLSLIVTVLGIVLSVFSMVFIFLGKRIQGTSGKQQLSFKGLEMRTDSVILLICISVFAAIVPLYFQYSLHLKSDPAEVERLRADLTKAEEGETRFTVNGYVTDGVSRQPLAGARIRVVRITVIPPKDVTTIGPTDDQGSFGQALAFEGPSDQLKLVAEKDGYSSQEIVISRNWVTFPPVLSKKR